MGVHSIRVLTLINQVVRDSGVLRNVPNTNEFDVYIDGEGLLGGGVACCDGIVGRRQTPHVEAWDGQGRRWRSRCGGFFRRRGASMMIVTPPETLLNTRAEEGGLASSPLVLRLF